MDRGAAVARYDAITDPVDPQHRRKPAFDRDEGTFGQAYTLDEERRLAGDMPAGSVAPAASRVAEDDEALPPDNGRRAAFDPATGEVRGSGVGAGGGSRGEDLDEDSAAGDGRPLTGRTTPPRE
ncbi:MAG: hypothetical protein DI544_01420 [Sphingomonas taxi]|uniref:Uncharacterized protein n=1 Tax=Sphingomonas taxi TaxID=1549858 RepID=A0A2W5PAR8_9SPHN|nr:MAG: hypothetical protein DI544_01420 [Sphingomonas taxi]